MKYYFRWKAAGDTVIAAQKLEKMNRLNRGRKRFNAAIGFTKLEDPLDPRTRLLAESGADDAIDNVDGQPRLKMTPGFDKYRRMKDFASFFAISGIVYGVLLIFFGDNYGALIPENKSFFGSDLTKQENKAEIEVCVADTGQGFKDLPERFDRNKSPYVLSANPWSRSTQSERIFTKRDVVYYHGISHNWIFGDGNICNTNTTYIGIHCL